MYMNTYLYHKIQRYSTFDNKFILHNYLDNYCFLPSAFAFLSSGYRVLGVLSISYGNCSEMPIFVSLSLCIRTNSVLVIIEFNSDRFPVSHSLSSIYIIVLKSFRFRAPVHHPHVFGFVAFSKVSTLLPRLTRFQKFEATECVFAHVTCGR